MKYFVSSDVHSFYDEWMEALKEKGFDINNKDHIVIHCGDLLDRGKKPKECLKFINDLHRQGRAIMIKGNHEYLLEDIFRKKYFERHDETNGTINTIEYISGEIITNEDGRWSEHVHNAIRGCHDDNEVKYYLGHVVDYCELNNYIFVHGWIPLSYKKIPDAEDDAWYNYELGYDPDWRDNGDFEEASWLNGFAKWREGMGEPGKTIVIGHMHTSYAHSRYHDDGRERLSAIETMWYDDNGKLHPYVNYGIFEDKGIIGLDACTVVSHKVNVLVIEN